MLFCAQPKPFWLPIFPSKLHFSQTKPTTQTHKYNNRRMESDFSCVYCVWCVYMPCTRESPAVGILSYLPTLCLCTVYARVLFLSWYQTVSVCMYALQIRTQKFWVNAMCVVLARTSVKVCVYVWYVSHPLFHRRMLKELLVFCFAEYYNARFRAEFAIARKEHNRDKVCLYVCGSSDRQCGGNETVIFLYTLCVESNWTNCNFNAYINIHNVWIGQMDCVTVP